MLAVITAIQAFIVAHQALFMGMTSLAFTISKLVSTEKSKHLIQLCQVIFDSLAQIFVIFGNLMKAISDFLANILKSDGFMGKK